MDNHNRELESRRSGSFGRLSGASSSRRHSFGVSFALSPQHDDGIESESVSEAGDIGDRALHSNRTSTSGRSHFSLDYVAENRTVVPIQDEILLHPSLGTSFPVALSVSENIAPVSLEYEGKKSVSSSLSFCAWFLLHQLFDRCLISGRFYFLLMFLQDEEEVPWLLEYITCLLSLAVFGILGVKNLLGYLHMWMFIGKHMTSCKRHSLFVE